jgi:uncharacterized membrane protein YqiK
MKQTLVERDGFGPVVIAAADDNVGIITVHDGPSLPPGEIYAGPRTADVSGEDYRHGELVVNGSRGVWKDPLLPGKYAFNTFAGKIEIIPTVNFILKMDERRSWRDEA